MRIPVFEEIQLKSLDPIGILDSISASNMGSIPTYIILHQTDEDELKNVLEHIVSALGKLKRYPKFPYPMYIVSNQISSHPVLPTVHSVKDLPTHYFRKVQRLKPKELSLLNKLTIVCEKLLNEDLGTKHTMIKDAFLEQRELYNLSKELHFLEQIMDHTDK